MSMKHIISLILFIGWLGGIVIANGFWSTLFALIVPFWSWYLLVERIVIKFL
jgi:hypothetical protein